MRVSLLPLIILCLFMGFTFWVMEGAEQSLLAFGVQLMSSPDTAQVVIDLYILAALACIWMYQDAKSRCLGVSVFGPIQRCVTWMKALLLKGSKRLDLEHVAPLRWHSGEVCNSLFDMRAAPKLRSCRSFCVSAFSQDLFGAAL